MRQTLSYLLVACTLLLGGCMSFKEVVLYDTPSSEPEPPNINGFYALSVFEDHLSGEVWYTEDKACIEVIPSSEIKASGAGALRLKWNKDGGGCDWVGLGIGWNGWAGKDISQILDKAAIQMMVRVPEGTAKGLPLACALEDYGGAQAWAGFAPKTIEGGVIDATSWTRVVLPFDDFNFNEFDCDATNIKQMIIQFEASGDVYVDDIQIVRYTGAEKRRASMPSMAKNAIEVDGMRKDSEYGSEPTMMIEDHKVYLRADDKNLYLCAEVRDEHPMMNPKKRNEIWNGDAVELAIGANPDANLKRKTYLMSDVQVGLRAQGPSFCWNWSKGKAVTEANVQCQKAADGYTLEASIPLVDLGLERFEVGKSYGIEVAIDNGNGDGRITQQCWSSGASSSFNKNPSLWGLINIVPANTEQ